MEGTCHPFIRTRPVVILFILLCLQCRILYNISLRLFPTITAYLEIFLVELDTHIVRIHKPYIRIPLIHPIQQIKHLLTQQLTINIQIQYNIPRMTESSYCSIYTT